MKKRHFIAFAALMALSTASAQRTFVHPGGLHTEADFERMRQHKTETPWKESWQQILSDGYSSSSRGNEANYDNIGGGGNRQAAARDAYTAYLNTLRWHIDGTTANADNAVRILNAWANRCTTASGELFQLPIFAMVQAAEMLRNYSGWKTADQEKFKTLVRNVFLPACLDFWTNCTHESWAGPAAAANMIMGVYLDDEDVYNQAVAYFKGGDYWKAIGKPGHGHTIGSVMNVVFDSETGQIGEMGRDQPHAILGPAFLALLCQIAWNQGDDLYSFDNNRLLKGFEYYCKYQLNNPVPWITYQWCASGDYSWFHISTSDGRRTNNSPIYEMLYNHYVVTKGLDAPYLTKLVNLARPEEGEMGTMGYGTFCYTLDASKSPYPGYGKTGVPQNLRAEMLYRRVHLAWDKAKEDYARGYKIYRSTDGVSYSEIASWDKNTSTEYDDSNIEPGKTYYYKVKGENTYGDGDLSDAASITATATGETLPQGWGFTDIGTVSTKGSFTYTQGTNGFRIKGSGTDIGSVADSYAYLFTKVSGDASISARLYDVDWSENTGSARRIGLVVRETLDPNAKRVFITKGDDWYRHSRMGYRTGTGKPTSFINGNDFTCQPVWFKIERKGNMFTTYQSSDSLQWYDVGSIEIDMNKEYYVGIGTCANTSNGACLTGTFDYVKVSSDQAIQQPKAPTDFTAKTASSSSISLAWATSPLAATYNLSRAESKSGPYKKIAHGLAAKSYTDKNLDFDHEYYYALTAVNTSGESIDSTFATAKTDTMKLPSIPKLLTKNYGNGYVMLSWNKSDEFTKHYVVKRGTSSKEFDFETITDDTCYLDQSVKNGTRYYYRITAENDKGESKRYAATSGTPRVDNANYWPLNEMEGKFVDVWNAAEIIGSSAVGRSKDGMFGNCVRLSNNNYLKLPNDILTGKSSYTISFWVNLAANTLWTRLFNFGNNVNNSMYITSNDDEGHLRYSIKNTMDAEYHIKTNFVMNTNKWYHIALTQNGSLGILYVDGKEVGRNGSLPYNASNLGSTSANYFGRPLSSDPYVNGSFDDIRIYRTALAPELVQLLTNTKTQEIEFAEIPEAHVGDSIVVSAKSSLGLPITLTSADDTMAKIVNDSIIVPLRAGMVSIIANQGGSIATAAAESVEHLLTIRVSAGISSVESDGKSTPLYDLCGRKVTTPTRQHIYIDGKGNKYVAK